MRIIYILHNNSISLISLLNKLLLNLLPQSPQRSRYPRSLSSLPPLPSVLLSLPLLPQQLLLMLLLLLCQKYQRVSVQLLRLVKGCFDHGLQVVLHEYIVGQDLANTGVKPGDNLFQEEAWKAIDEDFLIMHGLDGFLLLSLEELFGD